MTLDGLFRGIGDFLQWTFGIFEACGNLINYAFIITIFFGLVYWFRWQIKLNDQAENNPDQLK